MMKLSIILFTSFKKRLKISLILLVEGSAFSTEGNIIEVGTPMCYCKDLGIPANFITSGKDKT